MKTMTFGIEIETTGLRRQKAAETIATLIHGNVTMRADPMTDGMPPPQMEEPGHAAVMPRSPAQQPETWPRLSARY